MKIITDERCANYSLPGHPERPSRILGSLTKLRQIQNMPLEWLEPSAVEENTLLRAHTGGHVREVREGKGHFDGDTPRYPDIYDHSARSVGGALRALDLARNGESVFSLLRPPGHHATQDRAMGFCYFNSIAIAALQALEDGISRVAVFDFDVHHGNGTEAILLNQPGTAFYSIHQHPCYPGTGTQNLGENVFNYPVPPRMPREEYRKILEKALADMARFKPDLVGVSAGFDAYAKDPIAQETLEAEDFQWLGERLRQLEIPFFSVLEGGYSKDLPDLIEAYLRGVSNA